MNIQKSDSTFIVQTVRRSRNIFNAYLSGHIGNMYLCKKIRLKPYLPQNFLHVRIGHMESKLRMVVGRVGGINTPMVR